MRLMQPFRYIEEIAKAGSIRKAADMLAITPSALNRRLLAVEDELGVAIFERLPGGVRLNTAGEILLKHIRSQVSDMERVRSQIADLAGQRRGTVSIAASPELMGSFLSAQVSQYREAFPGVTFRVDQMFRGQAEIALTSFDADLAMVFEPVKLSEFQTVMNLRQGFVCLMPVDHPLAERENVRLYEVAEFALMLPDTSWGTRSLMDQASRRLGINLQSVVQTDDRQFLQRYVRESGLLTIDVPISIPRNLQALGLTARPIHRLDLPDGFVFVGHLKGRTLPVAAARFLEQLTTAMANWYGAEG